MNARTPGGAAAARHAAARSENKVMHATLSVGGGIDMPLGKTIWSSFFGIITDRFGAQWMVSLDH
jgi:PhnB protein